jgi:hypothetical protein
MRIGRFDEANFLTSPPAFDFLLAIDRRVGIDEAFVINQSREVITAGETRHELVFVLKYPTAEIASDAGVEDVGTGAICHDVDIEPFGLSHVFIPCGKASSRAQPLFRRSEGSGVGRQRGL